MESICCQNGGAHFVFLHSSGREELDSLPIVLELENTLWFSNSCLQLGTNSFAGIVLELCMDRELVAKMGEPIPIFYTLVRDFIFIFGVRHFRRGIHVGEFFPRFFWVNLAGQRKRFFVGKRGE